MIAFSNALAGLGANATAIDVVSSNLANLNTYGYKNNQVSFEDLVSGNMSASAGVTVGAGAVAKTTRSFTQGAVQSTGQPFDAAIQGNGFFALRTEAGQQLFTRAGNFHMDSSGNLLTAQGAHVEGWNAAGGVLNANGAASDIVIPGGGIRQPAATTGFSVSANLNANGEVGKPTGSFSSPMVVVDSLGNSHTLTISYTKTAANAWDYDVTIPSGDLASGTGTATSIKTGSLAFDTDGNLAAPTAGDGPVALSVTGLMDGASDIDMNWNIYDSNGVSGIGQYSQKSANLGSQQDGTSAGTLTDIGIGTNGQIIAHYSNGDAVSVAQIAVGSILNPESMKDMADNTYAVSGATAAPVIGVPGTGSRGQIAGGSLEGSTVDIAKEFTNLLTYERGYQANSKVITTADEIMQDVLNLKR